MKNNFQNVFGYILMGAIILSVVYAFYALAKSSDLSEDITTDTDSVEYYPYSSDNSSEVTSDNWECTDDCSGHEAGYAWAEENGITDPYECSGNSDSFIEGCEAYANEYNMEYEDEDYYEDSDYYW
jgi:hypothetical protein